MAPHNPPKTHAVKLQYGTEKPPSQPDPTPKTAPQQPPRKLPTLPAPSSCLSAPLSWLPWGFGPPLTYSTQHGWDCWTTASTWGPIESIFDQCRPTPIPHPPALDLRAVV